MPPSKCHIFSHTYIKFNYVLCCSGDERGDFDLFENANVAAANPDVVKQIFAMAKAHWEKSGTVATAGAHSSKSSGKSDEQVHTPPLLDSRLQFEEWWKFDNA